METRLTPEFAASARGQRAESILRSCVHCGFCNATCPTYQLLGDELDGPRGRIYLIKQVLEGAAPTVKPSSISTAASPVAIASPPVLPGSGMGSWWISVARSSKNVSTAPRQRP